MGRPTLASDSSFQATDGLRSQGPRPGPHPVNPRIPTPSGSQGHCCCPCPPLGTRKEEKGCLSPPTGAPLTPLPSKPTHQGLRSLPPFKQRGFNPGGGPAGPTDPSPRFQNLLFSSTTRTEAKFGETHTHTVLLCSWPNVEAGQWKAGDELVCPPHPTMQPHLEIFWFAMIIGGGPSSRRGPGVLLNVL